jgi:hypothetical protein
MSRAYSERYSLPGLVKNMIGDILGIKAEPATAVATYASTIELRRVPVNGRSI